MISPGRRSVARHRYRWATYRDVAYLVPIICLYVVALFVPLIITVKQGLELGVPGWASLLRNPLLIRAGLNTIWYSSLITIVATVLAYTVAAAIWRSDRVGRTILTAIVLLSFWTMVMVKIVAWDALLRDNGIINTILMSWGLIDEPLRLFPGSPAVILGMIQFVLPFAVFPILGVMLRLDRRLEYAAESLGAGFWSVFRRVVFPLTLPGVIASALLVFVICTGFYIIPALLGSPRNLMISNVVAIYALQLVNFHVASAVSVLLLLIVGLLTIWYQHMDQKLK